jgi:hypothetical protein
MSKQPQKLQNMQSEFSDVLKQTKLSPLARELPISHTYIRRRERIKQLSNNFCLSLP